MVFRHVTNDGDRTRTIAGEVVEWFWKGRKVLVLTERTDHQDALTAVLQAEVLRKRRTSH